MENLSHNLKVTGSNPAPETIESAAKLRYINNLAALIVSGRFSDSGMGIYWESRGRNLQTTPDRLGPAGHEDSSGNHLG